MARGRNVRVVSTTIKRNTPQADEFLHGKFLYLPSFQSSRSSIFLKGTSGGSCYFFEDSNLGSNLQTDGLNEIHI